MKENPHQADDQQQFQITPASRLEAADYPARSKARLMDAGLPGLTRPARLRELTRRDGALVGDVAGDDGRLHLAAQLVADERRVLALAGQRRCLHGPARGRVEQADVGYAAD